LKIKTEICHIHTYSLCTMYYMIGIIHSQRNKYILI